MREKSGGQGAQRLAHPRRAVGDVLEVERHQPENNNMAMVAMTNAEPCVRSMIQPNSMADRHDQRQERCAEQRIPAKLVGGNRHQVGRPARKKPRGPGSCSPRSRR